MRRKKSFDCVEMQHRGGDAIYEATKNMTREEELAWWREKEEALIRKQEALRARGTQEGALVPPGR